MHPYVIEQLVAARQQELRLLAGADRAARAARHHRGRPAWRRAVVRALVAAAVAVGVPPAQRRAARCEVTSRLGLEPGC